MSRADDVVPGVAYEGTLQVRRRAISRPGLFGWEDSGRWHEDRGLRGLEWSRPGPADVFRTPIVDALEQVGRRRPRWLHAATFKGPEEFLGDRIKSGEIGAIPTAAVVSVRTPYRAGAWGGTFALITAGGLRIGGIGKGLAGPLSRRP